MTESLLYKQIVRFFEEEKIRDKFEIKFIEIPQSNLPPKRFRSGSSGVTKEQIEQMADSIVEYLESRMKNQESCKVIAYVRGSYLEATRLAAKKSGIEIKEIFSDDELAQLKKKGIRWMKIGLRMPEAFTIFKRRIEELVKNDEEKQLSLF